MCKFSGIYLRSVENLKLFPPPYTLPLSISFLGSAAKSGRYATNKNINFDVVLSH